MPAPPRKAFGWCKPSGECPCCLANLAATVMLPGGRNRPPYRPGQTAGGTGNVVPTTSIYLSCRPFAADCRAGVHARRLGPCRIARWRVVCPQSQARPCAGGDACVALQPLYRPQCCPAGEIARPTDQGKWQAEQGTSSLRPAFIYLVARLRQIVGRAFTPAAWGLAVLPVGVLSGPKAKRVPAQGAMQASPRKAFGRCKPSGECPCCLANLAATVMLPGGRNRPPYNIRQKPPLCGRVHLLGTRFR